MTKMGEQARDELGKINETAVQIIEEMKERERVEKHVGWLAWNAVVQVLGWIGRGIWGGPLFYSSPIKHELTKRYCCSRPHVHRQVLTLSCSTHCFVSFHAPLVSLSVCFLVAYGSFLHLFCVILSSDIDENCGILERSSRSYIIETFLLWNSFCASSQVR
jgi:hypothetical protein